MTLTKFGRQSFQSGIGTGIVQAKLAYGWIVQCRWKRAGNHVAEVRFSGQFGPRPGISGLNLGENQLFIQSRKLHFTDQSAIGIDESDISTEGVIVGGNKIKPLPNLPGVPGVSAKKTGAGDDKVCNYILSP